MAPFLGEDNLEGNHVASANRKPREAASVGLCRVGGNEPWLFDPVSGLFNLCDKGGRRLSLLHSEQEAKLQNYSGVTIDPSKTCLIIVDMQNYFIDPSFHQHSAGQALVEPLLRTIANCREQGIQIAWLNWVISEDDMQTMPPAVQRCFSTRRAELHGHGWGVNLGARVPSSQGGGRVLWEGSWNAETYGPLKASAGPTDVVCYKSRMSGLWRKEETLHRYLCDNGFKTLLFAGINTDQCLLSTMTDAYSWGWDVVMLKDCTGTATKVKGAQELVEYNVATNMGFVFESSALINALATETKLERVELARHDSGISFE
jgi:phosphatidylethanolamine-binding protein